MSEVAYLECPICGGTAIMSSNPDGLFYDGEGDECIECFFPGHVSCDGEGNAWWVAEDYDEEVVLKWSYEYPLLAEKYL